ncbi:MAG: 2-oxoacid:acceptor oxidoreductase family protein [Spirochaetota bacterium]
MQREDNTTPEHRIIIAGFGGQGVLTLGRLLCMSAMEEGREVTYLPSYGSEVRGGTANCHVVISEAQIFSPFVETADSAVIMNYPSFERFGGAIRPGGLLVLNTSLVDLPGQQADPDHELVGIPATRRAAELGNVLVANVILLGALLESRRLCRPESVKETLRDYLSGPKSDTIELNLEALELGRGLARKTACGG